ncbi:MAG: adenylate/guanylate cyclase domain-containing protein [Chloroflexota bacterium]
MDREQTIAEQFDAVSILFADVVGYTPLTAQTEPAELVAMLNDIYSAFDGIVAEHGLKRSDDG